MIRARNQAQGQKDSSKKINICVSRGFASEEDTMPHSISASYCETGALTDSGARMAASKHQQSCLHTIHPPGAGVSVCAASNPWLFIKALEFGIKSSR